MYCCYPPSISPFLPPSFFSFLASSLLPCSLFSISSSFRPSLSSLHLPLSPFFLPILKPSIPFVNVHTSLASSYFIFPSLHYSFLPYFVPPFLAPSLFIFSSFLASLLSFRSSHSFLSSPFFNVFISFIFLLSYPPNISRFGVAVVRFTTGRPPHVTYPIWRPPRLLKHFSVILIFVRFVARYYLYLV